ncbi:MAG: DUF4157 domain-containing protein [Alphaproteobacteria bacterium]
MARTAPCHARAPSPVRRPQGQALGPSLRVVQAKPRVGRPDDPLEREADRIADRVMGDKDASGTEASGAPPTLSRKCAECAAEEKADEIHMKASDGGAMHTSGTQADATQAVSALQASGAPLPTSLRAYFEPRFGRDLSGVRIHTGATAASAAEGINARAYTLGSDIAFAAGEYAPASHEGRRLIAHELAHVGQQADREPAIRRTVSRRSSRCPANVHGAPADPLAALDAADQRAQTIALGSSLLFDLESINFRDPTFGPGDTARAYGRRFAGPLVLGNGQFRNRFTGAASADMNEVIASEMRFFSARFNLLHRFFSDPVQYRCPGTAAFTLGGCQTTPCGTSLAQSCREGAPSTIAICPAFWTSALNQSADQRAAVLLHEAVHIVFNAAGHGHANASQRLRNPNCYEAFVADVYGFPAILDDCPPVGGP